MNLVCQSFFYQFSGSSCLAIKALWSIPVPGCAQTGINPENLCTLFFNNKMTDVIEHQTLRARGLVGYDVALTWRRS